MKSVEGGQAYITSTIATAAVSLRQQRVPSPSEISSQGQLAAGMDDITFLVIKMKRYT